MGLPAKRGTGTGHTGWRADGHSPFQAVRAIRHKPPRKTIDEEQRALGSSASFWKLIEKRREENGISRKELERALESV
uniref:Uncharacterized protein n=1 Tax=Candidatus Kentrum sp. SD TaxID=2126332 RepID=A0A451BMC2_9GAMM|nr:MAG: hypothetical protein BECKSD772D_GA0070982_105027 [Candidatus Kentron sp. SD]